MRCLSLILRWLSVSWNSLQKLLRRGWCLHGTHRRLTPWNCSAEILEQRFLLAVIHASPDAADGAALSLRQSLTTANLTTEDDTIELETGRYQLSLVGRSEDLNASGDLDVLNSVTINGAGRDDTIIDANSIDRIFHIVGPGISLTLRNLTLTEGDSDENGGAVFNPFGTLVLDNVRATFNTSHGSGSDGSGGGAVASGTTTSFTANTTIIHSMIDHNTADNGNGGGLLSDRGLMTIQDTILDRNTASGRGGGLALYSQFDVSATEITNNTARIGAGAEVDHGGTGEFFQTHFIGNTAVERGGGLSIDTTGVTLTNSVIQNNNSIVGAAFVIDNGSAALAGLQVTGNTGTTSVVFLANFTASMVNTTISNNSVTSGAVVTSAFSGHLQSENNAIVNNTGIGVWNVGTELPSFKNTIVANNSVSDLVGAGDSVGGNLIRDIGSALGFVNGTNRDQIGTAAQPIDPQLGLLADNGGPTKTHALLAGSPAIDAGISVDSVTTDQRGFPRGAVRDIGAFELVPVVFVAVSPEGVRENQDNNLTYTVTRGGDLTIPVTVNFVVSGSATADIDYSQTGATTFSETGGTIEFAADQTTAMIVIDPRADGEIEPDESVVVTLSESASYGIGTNNATGMILNDDLPIVTMSVNQATVIEGGLTNSVFRVTRTGSTTSPLTIHFAVGGTATFGTDYSTIGATSISATVGTFTFGSGESTKDVTIDPTDDTAVETSETVVLMLVNGNYIVGSPAAAMATIVNDDSSFTISPLSASKAERNSGKTTFSFTISRNGITTGNASVKWFVAGTGDHPAQANDFGTAFPSGSSNFLAEQTSKVISINVKGDTTIDFDETFSVTLANAIGASIDVGTAVGTILNDDTVISIAAASATNREGNSGSTPFTFNVTATPAINVPLTVKATVSGAGANAADFFGGVFPTKTVTFAVGQSLATLTFDVRGDTVNEKDESFGTKLSSPSTGKLGTASASGVIQNDDASLAITAANAKKAEGTNQVTEFVFKITRTGDTAGEAIADYVVSAGNLPAADGTDFAGGAFPFGTVRLAAGELTKTFSIPVNGDDVNEPNENFVVRLVNASGATIGTASASGTILNDENRISLAATTVVKAEGQSNKTRFTFTPTRTGVLTGEATVRFEVIGSGDNPADAADFGGTFPTGTVSFPANKNSATIAFDVTGDLDVEDHETFIVRLFDPVGAVLDGDHSEGQGKINNDDVLFSIEAGDTAVSDEGTFSDGTAFAFTFIVSRFGRISGPVSARISVAGFHDPNSDHDPANAADFGGVFPSITVPFRNDGEFEAGIMVSILVRGDASIENDDDFIVRLSHPVGGRIDPDFASALGTIINDDFGDDD